MENWERIEEIYCEATAIENEGERTDFVTAACQGDQETRRAVESLLELFYRDNIPPPVIEGIRFLSLLGEGGMGSVYLAEQEELSHRRVAVKVINTPRASKEAVTRFGREIKALARMSHSNVATIHTSGTSEDGRPYFIMEYVPGVHITKYANRCRLSIVRRLELIQKVCRGVHHAHEGGLIHRDVKPSNILVMEKKSEKGDEVEAVPKLIDFGIVKPMRHPLDDKRQLTDPDQPPGTWEYMSPEQARSDRLGVDARTDIYSLGVVLYELLVGSVPLTFKEINKNGRAERHNVIRRAKTELPRKRLTRLDSQKIEEIAKERNTKLEDLLRELQGDLQDIVLKALAKERNLRYPSAERLCEDIGKLLSGVRRSLARKLWEFCKKHKRPISAAAALALAVLLGVILFPRGKEDITDSGGPDAQGFTVIPYPHRTKEKHPWVDKDGIPLIMKWDGLLWGHAIASISSDDTYAGLTLKPQVGLVPIGQDPDSKLWEFAHLRSGEEIPQRDGNGKLGITEKSCLVFVLIPGGEFWMGVTKDKEGGYVDGMIVDEDFTGVGSLPHKVKLDAFFLSKYEMTQSQWMALSRYQENESKHRGDEVGRHDLLRPVGSVSWDDCIENLRKTDKRLTLPTEAQWEYAYRAGTTTRYFWGNEYGDFNKYAWFEEENKEAETRRINRLLPNAWGLHDMAGNVFEWCLDSHVKDKNFEGKYFLKMIEEGTGEHKGPDKNYPHRIARGGCVADLVPEAHEWLRSWSRGWAAPKDRHSYRGLRPARLIWN